jgi:transcriptional regulator NrdR family protein
MRIRVLKCDGVVEPYLHTKVLGSFHNALAAVDENDLTAAEQLAEAVTFYLYHNAPSHTVSSDQVHLLIQSVLASTGFPAAAEALNKHRLQRKLKRKRILVIDFLDQADADESQFAAWNKSRIVTHLMEKRKMDRLTARTIAASVEEKVLRMGITRLRSSLIRELVAEDAEAILRAERQLQTVL